MVAGRLRRFDVKSLINLVLEKVIVLLNVNWLFLRHLNYLRISNLFSLYVEHPPHLIFGALCSFT